MSTITTEEKHPKGLYLLFFAEMWERFSFYGNRALLVLFMTKTLSEGGLEIAKADATKYYGFIQGLCYLTPLIGGFLADRLLGQRKSILIGGLMMALAQFVLFMSAKTTQIDYFWMGIALLIVGNGFFKPNISTIVGRLYSEGSKLKDQAYTIFYMGINLGAMSPLLIGPIVEKWAAEVDGSGKITHYGFQWGFLLACLGMLFGQLVFNLLANKYLGDLGKQPVHKENKANASTSSESVELTKQDWDKMWVLIVITIFSIIFWLGFEQAGGSFTLYTDKYLDRNAFGWEVPTIVFQAINPIFILMLGYPLSLFWIRLGEKNPNLIQKMAFGLMLMGGGFFLMVGAVMERGGDLAAESVLASMWWMVGTYFVHTLAELMLSPVGLSAVSKLAPKALTSVFMGVWFLSPFIAHSLAGYTESYIEDLGAYKVFNIIGVGGVLIGVVMLAFSGKLKAMMHGADKQLN